MVTGVSRIAAFGAATGPRVPAAPAALAWPATSSDPAWVRAPVVGVYGGLLWRTWAAGEDGRDASGAVGEDALVLGAAVWSVRQERCC